MEAPAPWNGIRMEIEWKCCFRMEIVEMLLQNGNTKIRNCNGWPLPASVEEIKHALMSLLELVSIENTNTLTESQVCWSFSFQLYGYEG